MPTCKQCSEEFELMPNKTGFANVCPTCTENPEQSVRMAAEQEKLRKSLKKAIAINKASVDKKRVQTILEDRHLESLGFKKVPGKSFTVRAPN
jgi:hypothetical protein